MCSDGYYTMIPSKNHIYDLRLGMVRYAAKHGIRQTAIHFQYSRNTVRKWVRRFKAEGLRRLRNEFDVPYGVGSIARVKRENGLSRKRPRKHKKRNDLRAVTTS